MDKQTQKNLLGLVKRNYEEIAADFDNTRKKYLWPELLELVSMVKDGDNVLDVGCGNGRFLRAFGEKKINYLGVDSSEALIQLAKKNFLDSRLRGNDKDGVVARNDKWAVGDILELDKLPEHDFDYIFCVAVLHHLPGEDLRVQALKQMKDKLKSGGKIIITVWNLWNQPKFRKLIFKYAWLKLFGKNPPAGEAGKMDFGDILFGWKNNKGEEVSQRYYYAFTKRKLRRISEMAGLKVKRLYKDKYNYYLILEK